MEKKRIASLAVLVMVLIAGFLFYFFYTRQPPIQGQVINGGRDEHGCILGQGFRWNATAQSCIENLFGILIYQVTDFTSCYNAGYAVNEDNETGLLQCHTLNGTTFTVNSNSTKINLTNSSLSNTIYTSNFTISNITDNSANNSPS
ncbi:MAG: hypothetical protein KGH55_03430 [Nanoarchaeota archaeon]|nr:hypothetical protein [Nanoarchaeota archaeon]